VSTILKALRRLEREKAPPADSQTLREAVTAGGAEPAAGSDQPVWLVPGIALLLGIVVGAGFLLLWPHSDVEAAAGAREVALGSPAVAPAEVAPPVKEIAPPARQRVLPSELPDSAEEAGLPAAAFSSPVEVVARPAREPRIPAPEPEPEPAVQQAAPAPAGSEPRAIMQAQAAAEPDPWLVAPTPPPEMPATSLPDPPFPTLPVVRETRRSLPLEEPPASAPEPEPRPEAKVAGAPPPSPPLAEASAPTPEPVAPPTPASEAPAPVTPASFTLRVERTWWHPLASRREALVVLGEEEVRVSEGQLVGDATVKQIEPSAVVFTRGETDFRRLVGESASE
jgi:hypothetical protein